MINRTKYPVNKKSAEKRESHKIGLLKAHPEQTLPFVATKTLIFLRIHLSPSAPLTSTSRPGRDFAYTLKYKSTIECRARSGEDYFVVFVVFSLFLDN